MIVVIIFINRSSSTLFFNIKNIEKIEFFDFVRFSFVWVIDIINLRRDVQIFRKHIVSYRNFQIYLKFFDVESSVVNSTFNNSSNEFHFTLIDVSRKFQFHNVLSSRNKRQQFIIVIYRSRKRIFSVTFRRRLNFSTESNISHHFSEKSNFVFVSLNSIDFNTREIFVEKIIYSTFIEWMIDIVRAAEMNRRVRINRRAKQKWIDLVKKLVNVNSRCIACLMNHAYCFVSCFWLSVCLSSWLSLHFDSSIIFRSLFFFYK